MGTQTLWVFKMLVLNNCAFSKLVGIQISSYPKKVVSTQKCGYPIVWVFRDLVIKNLRALKMCGYSKICKYSNCVGIQICGYSKFCGT